MPDASYALKRCSACTAEKPLDAFPKDRSRPDGRMSRCRECDNARAKRYYQARIGRPARRYEKRTTPRTTPLTPTLRICRECGDQIIRASQYRYCSDACSSDARRKQERVRSANAQSKRRTAKRHTDISVADERRIRQAKRCALCRAELTEEDGPRKGHLDHIIPINVGGTHTHGNVRMLCRTCNLTRPKDASDVIGPVTLWAQDSTVFVSKAQAQAQRAPARDAARAARRQAKAQERAQRAEAKLQARVERATRALELRDQGHSWQHIAEALDYASTGAVYSAVTFALGATPRGRGHRCWKQ